MVLVRIRVFCFYILSLIAVKAQDEKTYENGVQISFKTSFNIAIIVLQT